MQRPFRVALLGASLPLVVAALFASCAADSEDDGPLNEYGNPLTVSYRPTVPEITARDLQIRLYAFAHDSMMGRMRGREGNMKGTDYIARELERLGLEPGGENGTYFQGLPFVLRRYTDASTLVAGGAALTWLEEWVALPGAAAPLPLSGAEVVYGGSLADPGSLLDASRTEGRFVVVARPAGTAAPGGGGRGGGPGLAQMFPGAVAIATVDLEQLGPSARALINNPAGVMANPDAPVPPPAAANLRLTAEGARKLFGRPLEELEPGATGGLVEAVLDFEARQVPEYARNVVAIVRGSDPVLANEYVALGAHNDHTGFNVNPVDHDSTRARARLLNMASIVDGELVGLGAEVSVDLGFDVDSLRALRPPRLDSINNGADDDGSGSMALLEIAEALAAMPVKPRRSVILVWHNAEEGGLTGSRWFVENPTVPIGSIVANLNMDMIGRGRAEDVPGGSDDLLFVIGSYNDSRELGEIVAEVNQRQSRPLQLDYRLDPPTEWPGYNNLYGRSDHINYARAGIPIAFFFTGLHYDYHRVTDEPQYILYPKLERIARYVLDVALELGNRDVRPALDPPEGN